MYTDLTKIPLSVGSAIQNLLNQGDNNYQTKMTIVGLWLRCELINMQKCDEGQIEQLYSLISEVMQNCQCRIKMKGLRKFEELTVEQYVDVDEILQDNENAVIASSKIIDIMYKKRPKRINTGYAVCFFSYIMREKACYTAQFPDVFQKNSGDGGDNCSVASLWGWTNTLYSICNNDIRQVNVWLKEPINKLLVFLSWLNQKNEEETSKMKQYGSN